MPATVGSVLQDGTERLRASGSETARLDAELLLGHVLGIERTGVLAHPEARISDAQVEAFVSALERRVSGEPVAYIRGMKEFYGLAFSIDSRALIPRPETEGLVDLASERIRSVLSSSPRAADAAPFLVWDVGTGSGCIVIALAVTLRRLGYGNDVRFFASDVSPDAVGVAVENAVGHGVADRIDLARGDLTETEPPAPARVDLLVANLPYIPSATLPELPIAASFEPALALDGGPDGTAIVCRLLPRLPEVLAQGGQALLEIGEDQAPRLLEQVGAVLPGWEAQVHLDLARRPRVLQLTPPAQGPSTALDETGPAADQPDLAEPATEDQGVE